MLSNIIVDIISHYNIILLVASFLGACGYLYNKFIKPLISFGIKVDKLNDSLPELLDISKEFKNNGGSSFKDRVEKTERALNTLVVTIEENKGVDLKQKNDIMQQISEVKVTLRNHDQNVSLIQIQLDNITKQLEKLLIP